MPYWIRTALLMGLIVGLGPGIVAGQEPGQEPESAAPEASGSHRNTRAGLAAGITLTSVAVPMLLGGSTCRGSGSYLQQCRIGFVGAVAVGAGLGALAGRMVKSDGPRGRATTILVGSALGSVAAFLGSLPFCDQEQADNPGLLCGYDGMVEPGTVLGGAVAGGILGLLLSRAPEGLEVSQFGPVPTDGGTAVALAFTISR
jgi:hypothetical protein